MPPSIGNPQTYAEWYWNTSTEASKFLADEHEKVLAPIASDLISNIPAISKLPNYLQEFLGVFRSPPAPSLDNPLFRFVGNIGSGLANRLLGHEVREFDYAMNAYLENVRISPEVANLLKFRQKITDELWLGRQQSGGYSQEEALVMYESTKPYPSIPEIITYGRYHDVPDNPKEFVWGKVDISPSDWEMWNWLSFQKLSTDQVANLLQRRFWTEERCLTEWARLGWPTEERTALMDLTYSLPNAMLQVQGLLLQEAEQQTILDDIQKCGIHPAFGETYLDGILTKPSSSDILEYELRQNPELPDIESKLRRIGIHPQYFDLYKTLAKPIPPIQDIITMAVREAFSPSIASRFGQYEDMPTEYVEWAEKKGLSRDWAERYWAAHWSLPSPMQGFEMLHRGIIGREDLSLLLRAQDIMPYWRNKLIEMAYKPLTRVDVRRMFRVGVLDERGVNKAYTDLGYNEENAGYMTEFTIRSTRETLSGFRASDVINAYSKGFIDRGRATALLRDIGIKQTEVDYVINSADNKREWYYKQERIDAIANQYKKGKITEGETRSLLSNVGLQGDYIQNYIEQWELKSESEKEATWTSAQTLKFLKTGLISEERARQEFNLLGYTQERINVYIASVTEGTE